MIQAGMDIMELNI